jgi:hypothetical protein
MLIPVWTYVRTYIHTYIHTHTHTHTHNMRCNNDYIFSDPQLHMKDIILFSSLGRVAIRDPSDTVQPEGHK